MKHSTITCTLTNVIRLFTVVALLAGLQMVTQPVRADFYILVENSNDSGPGSLRDAIMGAYIDPTPNTIIFDPKIDGTPIVLTGSSLDINDGGILTIQGNGAANTIIDGGGNDRIFHVCPGIGTCTSQVTISGLTIRNGKVVGGSGAGGAIYNRGNLTFQSCKISDSTSDFGGAIYNAYPAVLIIEDDSVIGGVGGSNSANVNGGGIFNSAGSVTIHSSIVSNNLAYEDGGGIFNWEEGILNITNSTIGGSGIGNWADDEGGGIFNQYSGTTTLDGSAVSANKADFGPGIYSKGTLIVRNGSTIGGTDVGNEGTDSFSVGGGIYNDNGGTATVDGSTVSANTAWSGGGVENRGTLTVTNSTIGGTGAGNITIGYGGGITNRIGGMTTVDGSTVSANTAEFGGGIYNQATLDVRNGSTIGGAGAGNQGIGSLSSGGGIYNLGGTTVDGSTISANTAYYGGGIYSTGTLIIANSSKVSANQAMIWGGGIYNGSGSTMVTGSCILNNTATNNGGGLFNDANSNGATDVTGSSIVGNSATSFFNNQAAEQIATGNWWGAAAGPNEPGADTVGDNMNTSGYLAEPIPACLDSIYLPLVVKD